jgi:lysophospholipase L1-like esterase
MALLPKLPPRISSDLTRGNGVAGLGDSITQRDGQNSTGLAGSGSWFVQSCMASGQRMRFVRNAGVSGDTTALMLARIQADVIAFAPSWCFVLGGTNDIGTSVAQATIRANLTSIYAALQAANIQPILCTLTPRAASAGVVELDRINAWIRWYAQTHGYPLCDLEAVTMDPATGGWLAGYSGDNLHPNQTGATAMVNKVLADIVPIFPQITPFRFRAASAGASMLLNPNMQGVSPSANSWFPVNMTIGATGSVVADAANVFGNWQRAVVTTTGTRYWTQNAQPGWSIGDRLIFSGKITTSGNIAGGLQVTARILFIGGTGSLASPNQIVPIYQLVNDVNNWIWYQEAIIPPSTTAVECDLLEEVGTNGTVNFGEVTLINMTQQGFV